MRVITEIDIGLILKCNIDAILVGSKLALIYKTAKDMRFKLYELYTFGLRGRLPSCQISSFVDDGLQQTMHDIFTKFFSNLCQSCVLECTTFGEM